MRNSSSSSLISVPLYLPNRTRSPGLTSRGINSPCSPAGSRILADFAAASLITENGWLIPFHGLIALYTAHRLHRRNAAAALLDGGDSGLPPPAQLRARVLFSVFGVVPVLRRFAA